MFRQCLWVIVPFSSLGWDPSVDAVLRDQVLESLSMHSLATSRLDDGNKLLWEASVNTVRIHLLVQKGISWLLMGTQESQRRQDTSNSNN